MEILFDIIVDWPARLIAAFAHGFFWLFAVVAGLWAGGQILKNGQGTTGGAAAAILFGGVFGAIWVGLVLYRAEYWFARTVLATPAY